MEEESCCGELNGINANERGYFPLSESQELASHVACSETALFQRESTTSMVGES